MKNNITDGLLYQFLRQELPQNQQEELSQLVQADQELQERLDEIQWIDRYASPSVESKSWDKKAGWAAISSAIEETPVVPITQGHSRPRYWSIAASFTVLLVSSWLIWSYGFNADHFSHQYAAEKAHDEHRLPDGTVVWLDQSAMIEYSADGRDVRLQGKAYFDVARDESRPFKLDLETGKLEVLGTEFNVQQDDQNIRVSVTEGRVRLNSAEGALVLAAGQRADLNKSNEQLSQVAEINDQDILWHTQIWTYDEVRLSKVIQDINTVFNTQIRLNNEDLSECPFTTSNTRAGLDEWLDILSRLYQFNIERSPSGYILQGGVCDN